MEYSLVQKQERHLLWLLAALQFTHIIDFMMMMPLGPQLMRVLQIGAQQFGLLVSAYSITAGVFGFLAAFFADRFDRKHFLLWTYAGFVVATLLCGLAQNYTTLLLARCVAGAFGGMIAGIIYAIVGDVIPEQRRGHAMGVVMTAFSISAIAGVPLGLFLAHWGSWRTPFLSLTAFSLMLLVLSQRVLPNVRQHIGAIHSNLIQQFGLLLGNKQHLQSLALTGGMMLAGFSVIPYISPYFVANLGFGEDTLGYFYMAGGAATFFSARWIGALADRRGKPQVYRWIALASIIPILGLTHLPHVSIGIAIATMAVFMVLVSGRMVPAVAMITSSASPAVRGSFMSLNAAVQQTFSGLAALLGGLFLSKGPSDTLVGFGHVGWFAAGFTLVCIALSFWVRPAKA